MPLTNIIILALLAVAAIAAMGLGWMISKKNGAAGLGLKAVLALCLCVVVGCTAFVAVAAATGTLKPEVSEPAFDPEMNGHYENVVADNGDMVRVPIPTTTRQENSSEPMSAALPPTSATAKAS